MESFLNNGKSEYCSGCGACKEVCPKKCISFFTSTDGFTLPRINKEICINCNACKTVCPYNKKIKLNSPLAVYSGKTNDENSLKHSSSGGIFFLIASEIINNNGIVVGAKFDENFKCFHCVVENPTELMSILGSKYVQSRCSHTFPKIKTALCNGRKVLFSGTPCQIAGLKEYLGKEYENLFCIDLACHGVPSEADFEKCIQYLEKKHNGKVVQFKFRDKNSGGWYHSLTYTILKSGSKKQYTLSPHKVPYYHLFLMSQNIRMSCYRCPYVGTNRIGDITLADYWRAEESYKEDEIGKGISAILCNTDKGLELMNEIGSKCSLKIETLETVIKDNQPFLSHTKYSYERDKLLGDILKNGYRNTYFYIGMKKYVIAAMKSVIPERIKRKIRH